MILQEAKNIAIEIWEKLKPHCDICKVAGSIRREKPEVKDIEVVALPKMITGEDLFGDPTAKQRSNAWKEAVYSLGKIIKGNAVGKYIQILLPENVNLDLFMPGDFDYFRQYAVRTGSADWATKYLAGGWRNIGWCGSDAGLRLQSECHGTKGPDHKTHWKCIVAKDKQTLPPAWASEKEFFDWIKVKWVEPKYRNV